MDFRDFIRRNKSRLNRVTDCNTSLIDELVAKDVLSPSEESKLKSIPSMQDRASELYDQIRRKRVEEFYKFIDIAKEEKLTALVEILEEWKDPAKERENPIAISGDGTSNLRAFQNFSADGNSADGSASEDVTDFLNNTTPLQVQVKRSERKVVFKDDYYKLDNQNKGHALIINITRFSDSTRNRHGADKDTSYMRDLWSQLGYKIHAYEGKITKDDFKRILDDFKKLFTPVRDGTSCVVFIGSHGRFGKIETSDGQLIDLFTQIVYQFDCDHCQELKEKPKMFFIQACQNIRTMHDSMPGRTETDKLRQKLDDTIICFAAPPGSVANRDKFLGTWFVYCLTKTFMEHAHHMDLYGMLKKTQEKMRRIEGDSEQNLGQFSTILDWGIRKLYFNI